MKLTIFYIQTYIKNNIEYIVFFVLLILLAILITKRNWEGFFTEQNGINRLDAIIYINLENRQDRKELLLKELESLNTNMSKVHKVSGVYMPKNGHKGCIQSHILALNMIKLNKWKRVLILEDDAQLDTEPEVMNNIINQTIDTLDSKNPNWNVIMLATANKILDNTDNTDNNNSTILQPLEIYTPDGTNKPIKIEKIKQATTSSAYIIKDSYVDNILDLFKTCNDNMQQDKLSGDKHEFWALDQKWATLQEKDNWYAISPDPIKQRAIWSTILTESHT
jgi:GR25 family glycosyltransferase involved in LPS biosynthesis